MDNRDQWLSLSSVGDLWGAGETSAVSPTHSPTDLFPRPPTYSTLTLVKLHPPPTTHLPLYLLTTPPVQPSILALTDLVLPAGLAVWRQVWQALLVAPFHDATSQLGLQHGGGGAGADGGRGGCL